MSAGDNCIGYLVIAIMLSPVILQGIGTFGSDWLPGKSCSTIEPQLDCCKIKKSNYSFRNSNPCDNPFGLSDLDFTASSLHTGAFSLLLLPFVFMCFEIWLTKEGDDDIGCCGICGGICFLLYPLAGLLSFIGCMIIAVKFSGSSFGQSFKLTLSSGLIVLSITGILVFYICYTRRNKVKRPAYNAGQVQTQDPGGAAPYDAGPPTTVQIQSIRTEETHVARDSNGFVVFMKSINVFHLVTHHH